MHCIFGNICVKKPHNKIVANTHINTHTVNNSAFLLFKCLATFSLSNKSSEIMELGKLSRDLEKCRAQRF